ncbi:hypothetical protein [uncultured Duncaniella sp.]|uniref:hypothetical protein n=1 Tax=uncultured Duncaniella sp. TaxID=2768039 RepID=UPI0026344FB3|nr:hypothetical protein [uncultured Duncaniella sp.]
MSIGYVKGPSPSVVSVRHKMISGKELSSEEISLLGGEIDPAVDEPEHPEEPIIEPKNETMNYSPNFSNFASPISGMNRDETDATDHGPTDDSLLKPHEDTPEAGAGMDPTVQVVPSDVVDYYNEAALSTKKRNKLPDSAFGLPRLRAYPLNDEKHVRLAIQMFGHCKDPNDRATLAKNIFKKVSDFKMDVTISKTSALYDYAPKAMQEAATADDLGMTVYGLEKPMGKRTKEEIVREHLSQNSMFYNTLFFGNEYIKSIKAMETYTFLDYFYPSFKRCNMFTRVSTALGGLGKLDAVYKELGIRKPLETNHAIPLGWVNPESVTDFDILVDVNYTSDSNWFKTPFDNNYDHIFYCLRLYSVVGDIMLNPHFEMSQLTEMHIGLLTDWSQRVCYHYDLLQREVEFSPGYMRQAQYLYDLMWDINDNPFSSTDIAANIIAMVDKMAAGRQVLGNMNEGSEMISKEQCAGYLVHELGLDDDIFLLPGSLEYPIIDRSSVKLAMDCIKQIPADKVDEYAVNLNRKYVELGCNFTIPIDHPYAKYAVGIVDLNRVLTEGDTAVQDDGTSTGSADRSVEGQPWFRINDTSPKGLLKHHELGPHGGTYANQDYTRETSLF